MIVSRNTEGDSDSTRRTAPPEAGESRAWRPGDPDRRRAGRTLLELTGTTAAEHRPGGTAGAR